jgi:hypothetical protein
MPSTYRELYAAASFQAGEPEVAHLMTNYRFVETAGGGERPTPAALKEQTLAYSDRRPLAFLCLVHLTGGRVEVRVLHRMMRYYELSLGGGGATDMTLALLGDVRASQIPAVEIDNGAFTLIAAGAGVGAPSWRTNSWRPLRATCLDLTVRKTPTLK